MFISKNDLLFLILLCFFCSNMYLCKMVKQNDDLCSRDAWEPVREYQGKYDKDNKWEGTKTYDLKDSSNKCCKNKTFLSDCSYGKGRCVYCCRKDMQVVVDGNAFNTNPVPDTKTYSNNVLLKCCSNKTLTDGEGKIWCCSQDVVINNKQKYYVNKHGYYTSLFATFIGVIDQKTEVKYKCK